LPDNDFHIESRKRQANLPETFIFERFGYLPFGPQKENPNHAQTFG
jgi:hypothetical protein